MNPRKPYRYSDEFPGRTELPDPSRSKSNGRKDVPRSYKSYDYRVRGERVREGDRDYDRFRDTDKSKIRDRISTSYSDIYRADRVRARFGDIDKIVEPAASHAQIVKEPYRREFDLDLEKRYDSTRNRERSLYDSNRYEYEPEYRSRDRQRDGGKESDLDIRYRDDHYFKSGRDKDTKSSFKKYSDDDEVKQCRFMDDIDEQKIHKRAGSLSSDDDKYDRKHRTPIDSPDEFYSVRNHDSSADLSDSHSIASPPISGRHSPAVYTPPDLIASVPVKRRIISPKLYNTHDEGGRMVEIDADLFLLEKFIRRKLNSSGVLVRYARLSYSSAFGEFQTATMARHAIARINRLRTFDTRLYHYIAKLADPADINNRIIQRTKDLQKKYDPPKCLVVHRAEFHQSKVENYVQPFRVVDYKYNVQKKLLFTYHENEASVKDFYLAFQENKSGITGTYVTEQVHVGKLQEEVFKIIVERLIDACMNDVNTMLITDAYVHVLKRERALDRINMPSMHETHGATGLYLNFFTSKPVTTFFCSQLNIQTGDTMLNKVKKATKQRKTEMAKRDHIGYQKNLEIQMKEVEVTYDQIEQPQLDGGCARLTPIHKISEDDKRQYIRPYANARLHPLRVTRKSGLTLRQSQFQNQVDAQRRRKTKSSIVQQPSNVHGGKRVYFEKSRIQGWGLFALEPISVDQFICEYTGDLIRSRVADKREGLYEKRGLPHMYLFRIDAEYVVDATMRGGQARFLNHSCNPNCRATIINIGNQQTISFYAIRNIKPHDEITFNYNMEIEDDKSKWERCYCGAKQCTGYINYCEDAELRKRRELAQLEEEY